MSLLEEEQQQQEMMLALCLTGFCSAEAGKNISKTLQPYVAFHRLEKYGTKS